MACYHNITVEEMSVSLEGQGFKRMVLEGVRELVWGRVLRKENLTISMRIYSSIDPSGDSRGVGRDAIRVELYWRDFEGNIQRIGGSKRVHRVKGWKRNLQNRIDNWQEALGPQCLECKSPTKLRKPKQGQKWSPFYGCIRYPTCKGTAKA